MKKSKLLFSFLVIFILIFIVTLYKYQKNVFQTSEENGKSDWSWPEYPLHFKGVDCNTVPENSVGWPPGNDIPQSLRTVCWKERVWFENNWKLCEFIYENPKSRCYQIMAAKLNSDEICNHPNSGLRECKKYLENYRKGAFAIKSLIEENPSSNPL